MSGLANVCCWEARSLLKESVAAAWGFCAAVVAAARHAWRFEKMLRKLEG